MAERPQVDISTSSIFRALLVVVIFILLYLLSDVLIILLFAIVIASAVSPLVNWLEKHKIPRVVGVLMLYFLVLGVVVLVSSLVIPSISNDLSNLNTYLPQVTEKLSNSLDKVQSGAPKYFDFVGEIQNILDVLTSYLQQFSQSALNLLVSAFGGLVSLIAVLVISFYLAVQKNGIENFLESIVPERFEAYISNLWRRVERKVGLWLQGQLLLALIVGLMVYIGLSLLGVKFALLFAIIAMVMEIIPVAGPVLSAIPPIFVALLQQPIMALWVLIMFTAIQQFESHVLVPIVLGKATGMNPIVVILAILIGSQLAGIAGALIAVPVATIIVELLDDMARLKTSRRAT